MVLAGVISINEVYALGPEDCTPNQVWQNNACVDATTPPKNDLMITTSSKSVNQGDFLIISGKINLQEAQNTMRELDITNIRLVNAFGSKISDQINVNQQVQISADIKNNQEISQKFVYVVQVKNQNGVIVSLGWMNNSLNPGQTFSPALSWTPKNPEAYTVEIFVWDVSEDGSNKSWQRLNSLVTPLTLSISGNGYVSQSSNSVSTSNGIRDVAIIVRAPDNNIVTIQQVHPNADGSFQTSLKVDGPQFKAPGDYTVLANFAGLKSQITFEFTGGNGAIDSGGDSQPTTCPSGQNLINGKCVTKPTDTDGDGILDSIDQCPTQAETVNGFQDTDGCPDVVSTYSNTAIVEMAKGSSSNTSCADKCYTPSNIQINVGGTVTWKNVDTAAHTVTSGKDATSDGIFDSGMIMAGNSFDHKFDKTGTYPYYDMVHPWMKGIILVGGEKYVSLTDTDGDGILDSSDSCPSQKETVNGYQDTDGCPDVVPPTDENITAKEILAKKIMAAKEAAAKKAMTDQEITAKKIMADKEAAAKGVMTDQEIAEKKAMADKEAADKKARMNEKMSEKEKQVKEKMSEKETAQKEITDAKIAAQNEIDNAKKAAQKEITDAKIAAQNEIDNAKKAAQKEITDAKKTSEKTVPSDKKITDAKKASDAKKAAEKKLAEKKAEKIKLAKEKTKSKK